LQVTFDTNSAKYFEQTRKIIYEKYAFHPTPFQPKRARSYLDELAAYLLLQRSAFSYQLSE